MKFSALFVPLVAAASAAAHGFMTEVAIDGKSFKGPRAYGPNIPSIIRKITDPSPIKGANNPAVNCGTGARPASLVANAMPGSKLTFAWKGSDGNAAWPHTTGPMFTYMASCGSVTCDKFDSSKAKWFKIDQVGRKPNGGPWVQADLTRGAPATATIPANLAPGNYLVRNEIIGLHLGESLGGAEFYAGCAQLKVGGNRSGRPQAADLVSLPGAYRDNDAGIFYKDAFNPRARYQFPGPRVVSLGAAPLVAIGVGNGNTSTPSTPAGSDSTPTPAPASSSAPAPAVSSAPAPASSSVPVAAPAPTSTGKPKGSGSCKPKTQTVKNTASPNVPAPAASSTPDYNEPSPSPAAAGTGAGAESYYPRAVSRVMRGAHHHAAGLRRTH